MAKKARVSITNGETPKDEVALKNQLSNDEKAATPKSAKSSASASDGVLKVDGEVTSSNRKVRIATESPAASKLKGSALRGKQTTPKTKEAVATEVFGEDGKDDEESKHEPKHKDDAAKPAKGLLKTNAGQKRKALDAEIDDDQPLASTSKITVDATPTEDMGEIDFLAGFESGDDDEDDGQNSSDEEEDFAPVTQAELPKLDKSREKALKGKTVKKSQPGVIYLGRIPHGFHENEMRAYFTQFGVVNRLRLSRNKRTGASRHYAFVEFEHASVAAIVAETMDNYLLHGHLVQCKVVPPEEVHPKLWIGADKKFRPVPKGRIERLKHNAPKTQQQKDNIANRLMKRESAKRRKLRELGIEYDFDGYVKTLPAKQEDDKKNEKAALVQAKRLEKQVEADQQKALSPTLPTATAQKPKTRHSDAAAAAKDDNAKSKSPPTKADKTSKKGSKKSKA